MELSLKISFGLSFSTPCLRTTCISGPEVTSCSLLYLIKMELSLPHFLCHLMYVEVGVSLEFPPCSPASLVRYLTS